MKKILLILFVVFISFKGFGQTYYPFPTNYGIWTYMELDDFHNPTGYFGSVYLGGDTVIGSYSYKKLCGNTFCGGLRDSGQKIYYYNIDSSQEYLLYDFTASSGDTILNVWSGNKLDTAFIGSAWSAVYGDGIAHGVYSEGCSNQVYEGVGSVIGLTQGTMNTCSVSGGWVLSCCINDGVLMYGGGTYCVTDVENKNQLVSFEIYPNPSSEFISLKNNLGNYLPTKYKIVDLTGKTILEGTTINENINIEKLTNGMYFIQFENGNRIESRKFIKN